LEKLILSTFFLILLRSNIKQH